MLIYAIIPARKGSKGIKDKNIVKINKKPLIQYSIDIAKKSKFINKIIVSSDSMKYLEIASQSCDIIKHLRPKNISLDNSNDIEFFLHCINFLKQSKINLPDLFIHLRPTTPLRDVNKVDEAIKIMINAKNSSLRSVHETSSSVYKYFEIKKNKLVTIFDNNYNIEKSNIGRQSFQKTYAPNGYVDIIKLKHIMKYEQLHGSNVYPYITEQVIELDSHYDLDLLKAKMKSK